MTLEDADSKDWEADSDFKLSLDEFWSIGLVDWVAHHIDLFGAEVDFPTDAKSKGLRVTTFRSV